MSILEDLEPSHWAALIGGSVLLIALGGGGGFWLGLQPGRAEAASAKLVCSQTLAKQTSDALATQLAEEAGSAKTIDRITADVAASEAARQSMEAAYANLAKQNGALRAGLSKSQSDLGLLKSAVAGYASGAVGADAPACAAVTNRARTVEQLLGQGSDILSESLGLLSEGVGLLQQGANVGGELAADARALSDAVAGWQTRYRDVELAKPLAKPSRP